MWTWTGRYRNSQRYLANHNLTPLKKVLTEVVNSFDTPTDIDIYTFIADYEEEVGWKNWASDLN